jgi:hypothetical protein
MFVRVTRGEVDSLYECLRVTSRPRGNSKILLDLEGIGDGALSLEIDKEVPESVGVYYMNAEGQTIDVVFRKRAG